MGSKKIAYERLVPQLLDSTKRIKKFKILPCFFCEVEQDPRYNGINVEAKIETGNRNNISEYAENIKKGVAGYPTVEDISNFLHGLGKVKYHIAAGRNTLTISFNYSGGGRYVEKRKFRLIIDFIKRCIKHPVDKTPETLSTKKKILMLSRIIISVKSRWKHEAVAKHIRFMFRELKNRKDC